MRSDEGLFTSGSRLQFGWPRATRNYVSDPITRRVHATIIWAFSPQTYVNCVCWGGNLTQNLIDFVYLLLKNTRSSIWINHIDDCCFNMTFNSAWLFSVLIAVCGVAIKMRWLLASQRPWLVSLYLSCGLQSPLFSSDFAAMSFSFRLLFRIDSNLQVVITHLSSTSSPAVSWPITQSVLVGLLRLCMVPGDCIALAWITRWTPCL